MKNMERGANVGSDINGASGGLGLKFWRAGTGMPAGLSPAGGQRFPLQLADDVPIFSMDDR